jgi:ubiquinone/menaquinone biosynthesis C-methylase UbiE
LRSSGGNDLFEEQLRRVISKASDHELFSNYFLWRCLEFKTLYRLLGIRRWGDVLEIGCGVGFNSALISLISDRIVATELMTQDLNIQSKGIEPARMMLDRLKLNNCISIGSRAEELPFADSTFDVVFSSYVLEHLKMREDSLREMRRVLKPNGIIIATVPTCMERFCYVPVYYKHLLKKSFCALFGSIHSSLSAFSGMAICNEISDRQKRTSAFSPDVHGTYSSFAEEISSSRPSRWISLFSKYGLKRMAVFSTIVIPWHLLEVLHPKLPLIFYRKLLPLQEKIAYSWLARNLGHNLCLVYQRKE